MNNFLEVTAFSYDDKDVRTVTINGEPWWILKDVCDILDIKNTTETAGRLEDDEKSTLDSTEGGPAKLIINEAGLYSVIIRSDKPEAKAFKRWITHEVLPQIRRDGMYLSPQAKEAFKKEIMTEVLRDLAKTSGNARNNGETNKPSKPNSPKKVRINQIKETLLKYSGSGKSTSSMFSNATITVIDGRRIGLIAEYFTLTENDYTYSPWKVINCALNNLCDTLCV